MTASIDRRQALTLLLAAASAMVLPAAGKPQSLRIVRRWASGSRKLAPLTSNGAVLFAGDRTLGVIDTDRAEPRWIKQHGLGSGAVFRPRIDAETIVCGGLAELAGWDAANGERRWLYRGAIQVGVPCVGEGRVYVGDGHEVVALDARSGEVLWRFATTPENICAYAPVRAGKMVLAGSGDGILYALDADSGRKLWQLDRAHEWQYLRQVQYSEGVIVAGSYKELLYGIDPAGGKVLWKFNAGNFINSQHVHGDTAYLWSPTGWLYAIDIRSGAVRWRHLTNDYRDGPDNWGPLMAELQVSGPDLFALDMNHVIHVLDRERGGERLRIAAGIALRPTVTPCSDQRLLLATEDGEILLSAY